MNRNFRLTKSRDFENTRREGKSRKHKFVVLVYRNNSLSYSRVGIVASKKIGNAVKRNFIKRRMRASIVNQWTKIKPGYDMILYARQAGLNASYDDWLKAIHKMLESENLIIVE